MVAIALITLAIIVQAGVLVGMYIMSRRVTGSVDSLIADSRRIMTPLETVSNNLKSLSDDIVDSVTEARETVRESVRHWSAIIAGVGEGIRTFFRGKQTPAAPQEERQFPAA